MSPKPPRSAGAPHATRQEPRPSRARLRAQARRILDAAIAAVQPEDLVRSAFEHPSPGEPDWAQLPERSVIALAVGKAAPGMARAAEAWFGERLARGLWITRRPYPGALDPRALSASSDTTRPPWPLLASGHPLPDESSQVAGRLALELLRSAGPEHRVLILLSGGASALATAPSPGLTLEDLVGVTAALQASGAPITALNTVRKHLCQLKGGGMADASSAAGQTVSWLLSDVVGDPVDVIASGPSVPDPSRWEDVAELLRRYELWPRLSPLLRKRVERGCAGSVSETLKPGSPVFSRCSTRVLGSNALALNAARAEAEAQGYGARLLSSTCTGEAREVGPWLVDQASGGSRPCVLLAGGETTVSVRGRGKGGRNQELVLAGALRLQACVRSGPALLFSAGTDGSDGPTDAAGAWADEETISRAEALGLDAKASLDDNDSYRFFEALGDLIHTGPTGTNVMDIMGLILP